MKDEWIAVSQFNCLICFPKTFDLSNHIKSNCVQKTRFQLTVPLPSQGVIKNLPDHRMHLEIRGYLKLTLKIIAFVNMHKAKVELLARKNGLLSVARIWVSWFSEGPGRQTVDTRSTFGVPLKSFGYDGSNELRGRLPLKFGCLWDGSGTISWNLAVTICTAA